MARIFRQLRAARCVFLSMQLTTRAVLIDSSQVASAAAALVAAQPSTKPIASPSAHPLASSTSLNLKVVQGPDPDTIVMVFPNGTTQAIVDATIGALDLSIISGDSASGRRSVDHSASTGSGDAASVFREGRRLAVGDHPTGEAASRCRDHALDRHSG